MTPRFDRGYLLGIVVLMAACLPVVARAEAPQPLDAGTLRALGIEQPQTVRASATPPLPRAVTPHSGAWSWTTGAYSYDGSGNITAIGTQSFLYDVRGRLVDATLTRPDQAGSQHYAYSYDAFGNLTSRTGASTISTPTDTATNHLNGATYDDAGNVTLVQPAGQSIQYEYRYDALNNVQQIRAANVSDETRQLYIYTADDERIWSFDLGTNSSHWTVRDLSGKVARDYFVPGDTWTLSRDYIYRDGMLLAAVTPAETLHFSLDHLGTPRVITNDSRVRVGFHHYLPFGQEWTDHSGAQEGERMKFTSHERDSDPGKGTIELDYMHARYYSPDMGRFLSVDPNAFWNLQQGSDEDRAKFHSYLRHPQRWNRYAYVSNNPINKTDPDGREEMFYMEQLFREQQMVGGGTMTEGQYWARRRSEGYGALIGTAGAALWAAGPAALAFGRDALIAIGTRMTMSATAAEMTRRVMSDSNRMHKIFDNPGHKLDGLVRAFGSAERVVSAVSRAVVSLGKLPTNSNGVFDVMVKVNGQTVQVRGRVIDDVIRIGDFWVK